MLSPAQAHLLPPQVARPKGNWLTVNQAASYFNRSPQSIRLYCLNGTFKAFKYQTYRHGGRWFINIAPAKSTNSDKQGATPH